MALEALALHKVHQIPLVIAQGEDVAGGRLGELLGLGKAVGPGVEAGALARVPTEDQDGGVGIVADIGGLVLGNGNLTDGGALVLIVEDDVAAGGLGGGVAALHALDELDHGGVHRKAVGFQRFRQSDHVGRIHQLAHGAAELHLGAASHAEKRDLAAVDGGPALQSHGALRLDAGVETDLRLDQVGAVGVVRDEAVVRRIIGAGHGVVRDAEKLVDLSAPGVRDPGDDPEDHEQSEKDAGKPSEDVAFLRFHGTPLFFWAARRAQP